MLPPAQSGRPYRVGLVCLGNICRSPMAAVVLRERLETAGLDGAVEVVSGGTGGWHVGDPMDARAARTLADAGYDGSAHRAAQVDRAWLEACDLVLAMDGANLADVRDLLGAGVRRPGAVHLFRDYDPKVPPDGGGRRGADVPDPYYGGDDGFGEVLAMVERTADELTGLLGALLGSGRP